MVSRLGVTQSVHAKICIGMHRGSYFNFQNTFDSACDEIRLEIQSRNLLWNSNINGINLIIKFLQLMRFCQIWLCKICRYAAYLNPWLPAYGYSELWFVFILVGINISSHWVILGNDNDNNVSTWTVTWKWRHMSKQYMSIAQINKHMRQI